MDLLLCSKDTLTPISSDLTLRSKLIADGGGESVCGWLKDRFDFSWHVVPNRLLELIQDPTRKKPNVRRRR